MTTYILLACLFCVTVGQSPPIQIGDVNQYFLVKVNKEFNITCPFKDVDFYKWTYVRAPSLMLNEVKDLKIKLSSFTKSEKYECEAVNGYGKRTAAFFAKGIDPSSKQFDIDCQSRETGPCFLVSGLSNDFDYVVEENEDIAMDCRAVINSSDKETLTYTWTKISSENFDKKVRNSGTIRRLHNDAQLLDNFPNVKQKEYHSIDDMSKWGPHVVFKNITKEMDGAYQCSVSSTTNTIVRTFRLRVKESKAGSSIEGPLFEQIRVPVGSSRVLHCRALSKPKWGKKLEKDEETLGSDEIIKWGGSSYRLLQGSLDIEHRANGGLIKESKYYSNNLNLENIQQSHSGMYVCSSLTPTTLDHKYVNLSVDVPSGYSEASKKSNNFPIYIAVPTTIFIICLATIIYCLIHRRIRQKANFKNRAVRGTTITTTNSSSGNGSCSGSRNTTNARHHMLTTTTSSSKGSQNQFVPNSCYPGTIAGSAPGYSANHPPFAAGYNPAVMTYNYAGPGPYIQATNNTPSSTDVDHQCTHPNCLPHGGGTVPYDSDSTPSPPPPTSVTDSMPISVTNAPTGNLVPYPLGGGSVSSYSPNQSSQVYLPSMTPYGSSSTSVSSPNAMYVTNQQPVYPMGVMYSA